MIASTRASGHARSPKSAIAATNPATIVSGSPIPSSRDGTPSALSKCLQVDARRIGEEDDRERRFGERLDFEPGRCGIDEVERLHADDEAGGREEHGRGDPRPLDAARDRREDEEDDRERDELPVHGRSFAEGAGPLAG